MSAHGTTLDDAAWASPWRRVRVGEKVFLGCGLLVTALVAPTWPTYPLVAGTCVVALLGPARIPVRHLLIGASAPLVFILLGAATVSVRVGPAEPTAWFAWGPLWVDAASVAAGGHVLGRSIAGMVAVLLLAMTTPMADLLGWVRRLGVPAPLVEVASLTYRLVFVLVDTAVAILAAQAARLGTAPGGGWAGLRRRWHHLGTATGALLVRSWDRAARQAAGLEARGLDGDLVLLPRDWPGSTRFVAATWGVLAGVWAVTGALWLAGGLP